MRFRLELVGGPFDALAGLYLQCEPFELPASVRVGYCRGAGQCATDACPDRRHPAYWLEVESEYMPPDTVPYERRVVDVEAGRAVYAIGGLLPVDSAVAGDELPMVEQEHPLVTARVPDTAAGLVAAIVRARREWSPRAATPGLSLEAFTLAWESWAPDRAPTIWQLDGVSLWSFPLRAATE